MTGKQMVRAITFALIVCLMVVGLNNLFESENASNHGRRFHSFRNLDENVIDAVFIGTSGIDRYWISAKAFEEYGMSTYLLSMNGLPSWLYINMIEEALEYQNPSLFVLDMRAFTQKNIKMSSMDAQAHRALGCMDIFTVNRWKTAKKASETIHSVKPSLPKWDLQYFMPFVKLHGQWARQNYSLKNEEHQYGGYEVSRFTKMFMPMESVIYPEKLIKELDPLSEKALYELLDYIEARKLNVLFVNTPQVRDEEEEGFTNKLYSILDEKGVDYIAYYTPDQGVEANDSIVSIDMDLQSDFYDKGHANWDGAEKFTAEFAKYLDTHYDLPDRRGDEKVQSTWDGVYAALKQEMDSRVPAEMPAE